MKQPDHDVLIEIRSDLKNLVSTVSGYVPSHCVSHAGRLDAAEKDIAEIKEGKAQQIEVTDVRCQVNKLQGWIWGLVASILVLFATTIVGRVMSNPTPPATSQTPPAAVTQPVNQAPK